MYESKFTQFKIRCSRSWRLPDVFLHFIYHHNSSLFSGIPQIYVAANKTKIKVARTYLLVRSDRRERAAT